jgi:hypothetical protein
MSFLSFFNLSSTVWFSIDPSVFGFWNDRWIFGISIDTSILVFSIDIWILDFSINLQIFAVSYSINEIILILVLSISKTGIPNSTDSADLSSVGFLISRLPPTSNEISPSSSSLPLSLLISYFPLTLNQLFSVDPSICVVDLRCLHFLCLKCVFWIEVIQLLVQSCLAVRESLFWLNNQKNNLDFASIWI